MAQTHSSSTPEDDLTAVLGRFRAWTSNSEQNPPEPLTAPDAGLQEMSYEEALDAHRVRRIPFKSEIQRTGAKSQRPVEESQKESRRPRAAQLSRVKSPANSVRTVSTTAATKSGQQSTSKIKSGSAPRAAIRASSESKSNTKKGPVSQSLKSHKAPAQTPRAKLAASPQRFEARRSTAHPARTGSQSLRRTAEPTMPPERSYPSENRKEALAGPRVRPSAPHREQNPPTADVPTDSGPLFQSMLRESLRMHETDHGARDAETAVARMREQRAGAVWAPSLFPPGSTTRENEKSIAMKLRVSPGEHAKFKAGAAEAGVSLAGYMRQCTLDVQVLRGLLARNATDLQSLPQLAALQRAAPPKARRPEQAKVADEDEGFIARFKALLFGRRSGA